MKAISNLTHTIDKSYQLQKGELVAYFDRKYEGFTEHNELNLTTAN